MSSSLFCYLLCLLAAAQSNPVIDRQTVFQTPIENNQWMENLKNPCRSGTNAAKNLTILNIDGREAEIRIMSGNILSRLNSIKNQMITHQCHTELQSLHIDGAMVGSSQLDSQLDLDTIYKSAMLLSAHLHYMAEDWALGRPCLASQAEDKKLQNTFDSQGDFFEVLMCKLMDTTSGNDLDIPRPSAEMLENIYSRLGSRNIYHYRDCAGRAMRDCRVFNAATSFLQKLFNAVSAAAVL